MAGKPSTIRASCTAPIRLSASLSASCSDRTNHENGAFAEYLVAKAAFQFHIPSFMADEEAATLGVAVATVVSRQISLRLEKRIFNSDFAGSRAL